MTDDALASAPGVRKPNWRGRVRALWDPVIALTLATLLALYLFDRPRFGHSLGFMADSWILIAPLVIASGLLAAWLQAAGVGNIMRSLTGRSRWSLILLASLIGGLSPFCSCGVIPIVAALLAGGMPLSAVMAFWVSSPVMDPEVFVLTAAKLGVHFAAAKAVFAVLMGGLAGLATELVIRGGWLSEPLLPRAAGCGGGSCEAGPQEGLRWAVWRYGDARRKFVAEFRWLAVFMLRWLTLAFLFESLMAIWLPQELVASWIGGDGVWAIPISVLAGAPAYLNSYAAIPMVSGLMQAGMGPGPAMAFLTAGAVTSIPAAIGVYVLVRKPVFAWYAGVGATTAVLSGYLYQAMV